MYVSLSWSSIVVLFCLQLLFHTAENFINENSNYIDHIEPDWIKGILGEFLLPEMKRWNSITQKREQEQDFSKFDIVRMEGICLSMMKAL